MTFPPIRIVSPSEFDTGTAQTPGSLRQAAIAQEFGIETTIWVAGSRSSQAPAPEFTITVVSRRSLSFCQAYARCAGAYEANMPPPRTPATSSMSPPFYPTWKLIRQRQTHFTG